ncbi:ComEC/Rec2 family competence protein [Saccharibacillus alkalitolerans]|uniref:ComEC/Rec2 family competence protein n=1 Tax=Saccharibacillus alkalitolerans TaxID=2705290 RepID=A0ABX0EYI4_9BACL|nr:ComEC/Rec2 family competence protein [Saccharibacillus alkalitolerans]NGZ73807.1 ComEC/Rec2 family competence protein [Saccharibacillus alkalitolerans]
MGTNRRPLVAFTVCWIGGAAAAHLYEGLRMAAVLAALTLLLLAVSSFCRISGKALLVFGLAIWLAAGYGAFRDARNASVLPEVLGDPVEGGYAGIRLQGTMAGPAKIDGDLAMFELRTERAAGSEGDGASFAELRRAENIVVRVKLAAESERREAAEWGRGDRLVVSGDLELPAGARNFGAFDYRSYLRNKRIHWVAKAAGASSVETEEAAADGLLLLRRNDELRAGLADKLAELYPGIGAGYMQGLLLGLKDGLDPDTYTNFVRLGMTHVLAISGMHVGLYVGAVLLLLRRSGLSKETALTAALCSIPPYVLLTGSSPSAVRAGLMGMIGLYAARRGWLKDGLHILCLAALLMLLWDPYYLTAVSFQLSFAVTAGIILLVRPMRSILFFLPKAVSGAAAISLVADLVSFPLGIYYFNQYPLLGVAANLLLVPLISLVSIPLGTASLILGTFWMEGARWAAYPVRLVNAAVFWCADGGGSFRWARTVWASPSPAWIALYYAALLGGIFLLAALRSARHPGSSAPARADGQSGEAARSSASVPGPGGDTAPLGPQPGAPALRARFGRSGAAEPYAPSVRYGALPDSRRNRMRPPLAAASFALLAVLLAAAYHPRPDPAGSVQMLDVGQGDAILITTPSGRHLLVDGGGTVTFERPGQEWRRRLDPYEVGRDIVVPLLKKRGVHRLDAVILTHGDRDHYGGLLAVLDELPVDRFIMNGTRSGGEDLDKLLFSALRGGAEIYAPQDGDVWRPDDRTVLRFLNPSGAFAGRLPELEQQNEYSVVFKLGMNGHSFLFTGDIGESGEQEILARLDEQGDGEAVEVLKVGHHGSKHSSTEDWVSRWSPKLSLISVGAKNTYGHPNEGIIERLEQAGSAVRRTDLDGEIQIHSPAGEPLRVRTKLDGASAFPKNRRRGEAE